MTALTKTLAVSIRPVLAWTGILERLFREFLDAAGGGLAGAELRSFFAIPDSVGELAVSGALTAVRLEAGRDCLVIRLSFDPDVEDDLGLDRLALCDLSGRPIVVGLVVADVGAARSLGIDRLRALSSANLQVRVLSPSTNERPSPAQRQSAPPRN